MTHEHVLTRTLSIHPLTHPIINPPSAAEVSLERMGYIVLGVSMTVFFLKFPGHAALVWGRDEPEKQQVFVPAAAGRHDTFLSHAYALSAFIHLP